MYNIDNTLYAETLLHRDLRGPFSSAKASALLGREVPSDQLKQGISSPRLFRGPCVA
jgi:hypothetical protein